MKANRCILEYIQLTIHYRYASDKHYGPKFDHSCSFIDIIMRRNVETHFAIFKQDIICMLCKRHTVGTGQLTTTHEGVYTVCTLQGRLKNAGPENSGLKMRDWKM